MDMIQATELPSLTGRIKLVEAVEENDSAVAALRSHPETRKHLRHYAEYCSIDEARQIREKRAVDKSLLDFHVLRCEPDGGTNFIGTAMVFHIDTTHKSCEVGITMCPDVHRSGIATDVLFTLFTFIFEVLFSVYQQCGCRCAWSERERRANQATHDPCDPPSYPNVSARLSAVISPLKLLLQREVPNDRSPHSREYHDDVELYEVDYT